MQKELFYCRGSKENPEGVKKALEAKGGKTGLNIKCDNERLVYYIRSGEIDWAEDASSEGLTVIEYGTELQPVVGETFKPFDRVIVSDRASEWRAAIYSHKSREYYSCNGVLFEECHLYEDWMEKYLGTNTPFNEWKKD